MITRRAFLQGLTAVLSLPLISKFPVVTDEAVVIASPNVDVWDGIKVKYLGKGTLYDLDKFTGLVPDMNAGYKVYRYHLSKRAGSEFCEAYCEIDVELLNIVPDKSKYIKNKLETYAELIQETIKKKTG